MPDSAAAIAALRRLLQEMMEAGDPRFLVGSAAERAAAAVATSTDLDSDVEAASVLALFHWVRFTTLPDGAGDDDLSAATRHFRLVYLTDPALVPAPLREFYQRAGVASPGELNARGIELLEAYEQSGDLALLGRSIEEFGAAVAALPDGHPSYPNYQSNLGSALTSLFEGTGVVDALLAAIEAYREALACLPEGHRNRGICLNNLASALQPLYELTGDPAVLAEAVGVARASLAAFSPGDEAYPGRLVGLGNALRMAHEQSGEREPILESVRVCREAVALAGPDDPGRPLFLNSLSCSLRRLFELTGDQGNLSESVETGRGAVRATPADHVDLGRHLNNLAAALDLLFDQTGDTFLLRESVEVGRRAVRASRRDDPSHARYQSTLGNALSGLYERTGESALLVEAEDALRTALETTPEDHPDRPMYLNNLALILESRFTEFGDPALLREAASVADDAVERTPAGHPDRPMFLANLGLIKRTRHRSTGDMAALKAAVDALAAAVEATPERHPDRARRLVALGSALVALAEATGTAESLPRATGCFAEAARNTAASATTRASAYRRWAELVEAEDAEVGLRAIESAIGLTALIAPASLSPVDREHRLSLLAGLAGEAASVAVAAGRTARAVELLEQTRGILVADNLATRGTDLDRLRAERSDLADTLDQVRTELEAPGHTTATHNARHDAYANWQELIDQIRTLPGFAGFLKAPRIEDLAPQAQSGTVVYIYVGRTRSGALIVTDHPRSPVQHVDLDLTEDAMLTAIGNLTAAIELATDSYGDRREADRQLLDVLAWLWDTITEPVLAALGLTSPPSDGREWPRIWWCPVGVTAFLPLHAAGHHADLTGADPELRTRPRTVLDRAISSYVPTLRGLAYARGQRTPDDLAPLIIAVPEAPGTPPLPGVTEETESLAARLPGAVLLRNPTRTEVLQTLPGHGIAHFACHGHADWRNPSDSRLILYDHGTAPLTAADIRTLRLPGGLAYLSACDTSVTSLQLADEALHITAAFHLAGYQHVIGTLWAVSDRAAQLLTEDFYGRLTDVDTGRLDIARSSEALHHATRKMRAAYMGSPMTWAPHIHTGS